METKKDHQLLDLNSLGTLKIYLLLAFTIWIARFWHSPNFGLYEDDYSRVIIAMEMTGPELWDFISNLLLRFGGQGRPLHPGLIYLFSFLGGKLGGLHVVYWIGFVILVVNAILFYNLLNRLFAHQVFALTGALAFCLFPVDTTQAFITHSLGLQPSLTFLLIAFHLYLSDKRKLSYLFAFGSLVCYEVFFPVFLAAPLLKNKWDSSLVREILGHALVLGFIAVFIIVIRNIIGEDRVANLDILSSILTSIQQMIIGPAVSLATYLYRPIKSLFALDGESLILMTLSFSVLAWALSALKLDSSTDVLRLRTTIHSQFFRLEIPVFFRQLGRLALIGLIVLVLAYPFTYTVSAFIVTGRDSRVHSASVIGVSILSGCVCSFILFITSIYRKKLLAAVGLAGFFALCIGSGLIVQRDYEISWDYQQAFWKDVVRLCPDITDGTVILVDEKVLNNPDQIQAFSWSLPRVLFQLYHFPNEWKFTPRVYRLKEFWQNEIASAGSTSQLSRIIWGWVEPSDRERTLDLSNIILLEVNNGQLTRRTEPLTIDRQILPLKKMPASGPLPFEKGILYEYLIRMSNEERINYLK